MLVVEVVEVLVEVVAPGAVLEVVEVVDVLVVEATEDVVVGATEVLVLLDVVVVDGIKHSHSHIVRSSTCFT